MDNSLVGQKRIARGIHAIGGIGLSISNTGNVKPLNTLLIPIANPRGIPINCAAIKPIKMRERLMPQSNQ